MTTFSLVYCQNAPPSLSTFELDKLGRHATNLEGKLERFSS